jgi:hypothetical protein
MTPHINPAVAELFENPFFVINGPQGAKLPCQWTCYAFGRAQSYEFEIICMDTPEKLGCLFGLFDPRTTEFQMRPEVILGTYTAVEGGGCQDLDWRGSMDDLVEVGRDWAEGPDGEMVIFDPEEPVEDAPKTALRDAA